MPIEVGSARSLPACGMRAFLWCVWSEELGESALANPLSGARIGLPSARVGSRADAPRDPQGDRAGAEVDEAVAPEHAGRAGVPPGAADDRVANVGLVERR